MFGCEVQLLELVSLMRINFLDASTLHRDDIDFSPFEKHGTLSFYDTTSPDELTAHAKEAEVVITNKVAFSADILEQLPQLKLILIAATGYNHIDLDATRRKGIVVSNVAGYSTSAVAQHVFALLLNLVTHAHRYHESIKSWPQSPIFTRLDHPVNDLAGKAFGIVGLGETGSAVARVAEAFGMSVQALAREGATVSNRTRVSRETFFRTSDVISLHCPLNPETEELINEETLSLMKPSAFLINTGRGALINENAVAHSIRNEQIAGAGLDVLSIEPPKASNPLLAEDLRHKNLIMTPHTAWTALEARQRLMYGLLANLTAWLNGNPSNQVN